ncbi:MAG TPA: hypothetical protein RMH26_27160, partial [Polyangiaceae bacterium LLY-WYZ-15_(1-7)]|nr:hypothetical protein [Polyangiaceae bacterium LLY-WYZ-15_(1-7)]
GLSAVRVLRRLQREKVSSSVEETDFIGASGTVLLPVARGQLGQVRVRVKGRDLDVPAETQDDHPLLVEAPVLVCEVRDGVALVSRLDEVA